MKLNLSKKIIIIFFLLSIIPLGILSFITFRSIESSIKEQKLDDLMNIVDAKYVHLLEFLNREKSDVKDIGHDEHLNQKLKELEDPSTKESASKFLTKYLSDIKNNSLLEEHSQKKAQENNDKLNQVFNRSVKWDMFRLNERLYRYDEVFIIDKTGKVIVSSEANNVGKDLSGNSYFTEGFKNTFIKDPYKENSGDVFFGIASPFSKEGQSADLKETSGVLVFKINDKFLADLVSGDLGNQVGGKLFFAGIGAKEDFYLIDKNGYMITPSKILKSKGEDTVLKTKGSALPYERCRNESLSVREVQEVYTNYQGYQVGGASMCIFETKWALIAEDDTDEMFAGIIRIRNIIIITGIILSFIVIMLGWFFAKSIILPIESNALKLSESSNVLDFSSESIISSEEAIKKFVSAIQETAEMQLKKTEEISKLVTEMAASSEQISASSGDAALSVKKTSEIAQEGGVVSEQSLEKLGNISDIIENSVAMIKMLKNRSEEISSIVEVITSISDETNLLALNAAIEAARAGEAGQGFAVVAGEVRKLSDESRKSADKITGAISSIQNQISDIVDSMEGSSEETKKSSEVIKKSLITLQEIASASQVVSGKVDEISQAIKGQTGNIEQISDAATALVSVAVKNTEELKKIDESTSKQFSYIESIDKIAERIKEIINSLKNKI